MGLLKTLQRIPRFCLSDRRARCRGKWRRPWLERSNVMQARFHRTPTVSGRQSELLQKCNNLFLDFSVIIPEWGGADDPPACLPAPPWRRPGSVDRAPGRDVCDPNLFSDMTTESRC